MRGSIMAVQAGTRLGACEVLSPDRCTAPVTHAWGRELGRELAIKVLPSDLEWSATQRVELPCVPAVSHGTLPLAALPRGASVTLFSPWRARRLPGAPSGIR